MEISEELKSRLNGLKIEKLGTWIWISGPKAFFNEEIRNSLKAAGYKFSGNKKAWYLSPTPSRRGKSRFKDLAEIRESFPGKLVSKPALRLIKP